MVYISSHPLNTVLFTRPLMRLRQSNILLLELDTTDDNYPILNGFIRLIMESWKSKLNSISMPKFFNIIFCTLCRTQIKIVFFTSTVFIKKGMIIMISLLQIFPRLFLFCWFIKWIPFQKEVLVQKMNFDAETANVSHLIGIVITRGIVTMEVMKMSKLVVSYFVNKI